jgi:hypothetical protein
LNPKLVASCAALKLLELGISVSLLFFGRDKQEFKSDFMRMSKYFILATLSIFVLNCNPDDVNGPSGGDFSAVQLNLNDALNIVELNNNNLLVYGKGLTGDNTARLETLVLNNNGDQISISPLDDSLTYLNGFGVFMAKNQENEVFLAAEAYPNMGFSLIKFDPNGNEIFKKNITNLDYPNRYRSPELVVAQDGNLVVSGFVQDTQSGFKPIIYLVKMSNIGEVLWQKYFQDLDDESIITNRLIQTDDGGFLILGNNENVRLIVIKTTSNGDEEWRQKIGDNIDKLNAFGLVEVDNENYVICGSRSEKIGVTPEGLPILADAILELTKLDKNGTVYWQTVWEGKGGKTIPYSMIKSSDDRLVVSGRTFNLEDESDSDPFILKVDLNGNIIWDLIDGGSKGESSNQVIETKDGSYIIVGSSLSFSDDSKAKGFIRKIDENGNIIF